MTHDQKRCYVDRVRSLAIAQMRSIASAPLLLPPLGSGLTDAERADLVGCEDRVIAALERLLSHLGPDPGL